jgi:hypothetical protein
MSGESNDMLSNMNIDNSIPTAGAFKGMKGSDYQSPNTTVGSSGFDEYLKNPIFMKYLSDMGAGMMNKPSFGQAVASGNSTASAGMADYMKRKQDSETQSKLNDEQMRMVMSLFNKFGG